MVVIGIIGLLVAIALPALNAARTAAKVTTTSATVRVLDTGLEQFKTDNAVGGAYPPSMHVAPVDPRTGRKAPVCGASLLVWALAGADLLGTPGFRDMDGVADPFGGWVNQTDTALLYAKDPTTGKPLVSRSGPYVDLSKMKVNTLTDGARTQCFVDAFNQPILYYRANVGATLLVSDEDPIGQTSGTYTPSGIYNLADNLNITGNISTAGMDFGAGRRPYSDHYHFFSNSSQNGNKFLGLTSGGTSVATPGPGAGVPNVPGTERGTFAWTVANPSITAAWRPYRDDAFILLSAGPDGIFGTADDVANFPTNK
jgi:type II secretory pathway pseudopilin PulG